MAEEGNGAEVRGKLRRRCIYYRCRKHWNKILKLLTT